MEIILDLQHNAFKDRVGQRHKRMPPQTYGNAEAQHSASEPPHNGMESQSGPPPPTS